MIAAVPEGRRAAGAYPFIAAGVPPFLFFQPLLEKLHQLFPAVFLDGGLFFGGEVLLELLDQPVQGDVLLFGISGLQASIEFPEGLVVAVEQCFVLDQGHARKVIEIIQRGRHQPRLQRAEQGQVFLHRDRQLAGPQMVEEINQHGDGSAALPGARHGGQPLQQRDVLLVFQQGARHQRQVARRAGDVRGRYGFVHQ